MTVASLGQQPIKTLAEIGRVQRNSVGAEFSAVRIELNDEDEFKFNLNDYYSNQKVPAAQSIFIDTTQCADSINVFFPQLPTKTQNGISAFFTVPQNTQGWYYLPTPEVAVLDFRGSENDIINIILSSIAIPAITWYVDPTTSQVSRIEDNVTIASTASLSAAFQRLNKSILGFVIPVAFTGTQIEILGSLNGTDYFSIYNSAGQAAVFDISGGAGIFHVDGFYDLELCNYIKFQSNGAEASLRTITVISETLEYVQRYYG